MKRENDTAVALGFWIYLMSDCVLFAGLFATYAVLHTATFGGAAPKELFDLHSVFIETMLLLVSSLTCGLAILSAHDNKIRAVLAYLAATVLLGAGFLAMEVQEFAGLIAGGHGYDKSAFLSSFFTLVGTHGLHVFLGSLWVIVIMTHLYVFGITPATKRKLVCLSLFWHFLDIVWICIFSFVYLWSAL